MLDDIPLLTFTQKSEPKPLKPKKKAVADETCYHASSFQMARHVGRERVAVKMMKSDCQIEPNPTVRYSHTEPFLTMRGSVDGIHVYNNMIYVLERRGVVSYVHVFDLSGTAITSWKYKEASEWGTNNLTVAGDKVIVTDSSKEQLVVYSLTGEFIKCISYPAQARLWHTGLRTTTAVAISALDTDSVIVSSGSFVFKVNVVTEI